MKQEFWLPAIEPLSINSTYVRGHNGVVKSTAARNWTQTVLHALSKHTDKFKQLREAADLKEMGYRFTITTVYDKSVFFTKKGEMSSRTQDLSNTEKSIIDVFCLPKFAVEEPPYGVSNLMCDDKHVVELVSRKMWGEQGVHVVVEIVPLPTEPFNL